MDQPSSCIENQIVGNTPLKTKSENILEDPFIERAKELFDPSRIVVKSKI
jgi:hypothetical protein